MSRYNTPQDTDLGGIFSALKKRVDRLERTSPATSLTTTSPITATSYFTGIVVTSTTFVDTHVFPTTYTAPTPIVRITAVCSDASTRGEFRLVDVDGVELTDKDGDPVPATAIPLNTTSETSFENNQELNYWDELPVGTDRTLRLQVRRLAGTGTISIKCKYLLQMPS